jgi:large subunit ribosomal protein L10
MTKEQKAEVVKDITSRLEKATGLYLTNFTGMTVEQANNLRKEFYKTGVDYVVVKNTLLKRALNEVGGYSGLDPYLVQQTGLVVSYDDPVQPARVIEKFQKTNADKPAIKACVIEKQVFDGSRLSEVAALPTRNDLIANILGSISAPAQGIAGAINAVIRDVVSVVDAIEKKKAEAA